MPDGIRDLEAKFAASAPTRNRSRIWRRCARHRSSASCSTGNSQFEWTTAELVYDDPAKTLDTTERTDVLLFPELVRKIGRPEKTLDLVSPYFVPGADGTEHLAALAKRGVKRAHPHQLAGGVRVKSVHSGYAKRRRDLLQAGVGSTSSSRPQRNKRANPETDSDQARPPACMPRRSPWTAGASSSARSTSTRARRGSTPKWGW